MRRKQQIITSLLVFLAAGMIFAFANIALAKEYFGLDLGNQSWAEVIHTLQAAHAGFEDNYGYHGYVERLPTIKVISYVKFNKFGQVREGWLNFTPDKKLYRISVIWKQDHSAFKLLKDTLDTKYGQPVEPRMNMGFHKQYQYNDQDVEIMLESDDFSQLMSLTYSFTPALPEVNKVNNTKSLIEKDIKQKNAQKAGSDL